jgi:hypothetical protein
MVVLLVATIIVGVVCTGAMVTAAVLAILNRRQQSSATGFASSLA